MRIVECFDGLDPLALGLRERRAGRLADAVDGEDGRAIEARREIRRGGMRQMVGHKMKSLLQRAPKKLVGDAGHLAEPQPEGFLEPRIPPLGAISPPPQLGVKRVCDMTDITGDEPGVVQAKANRAFGELMRVIELSLLAVFEAIESFLLDGGDERAVDEQRGGRLVIH
jgi:hypothetical protein